MAQSTAFDSNAGQWPKFSGFKPLTPNVPEIRLLRLESTSNGGELRYSMRPQELLAASYCALSYSWGAPVPISTMKQINIEGEVVLIRPTLHAFLTTLASHDSSIGLWIDAVCINQDDVEERNQQIGMMGDIYRKAQRVYVWLGVGDDDTNYAFDHIKDNNPQTPFDPRQYSPCVEKIFRCSYWSRRWVIQEFALAQELLVVCGQHVTTWARVLEKVNDTVLRNDKSALQVMENFKQLENLGMRQHLTLLELMVAFNESRCIDRRDKAFALRGIAKDGMNFIPDYRESVTDVYFRILSLLPTRNVLPGMTGYRWPDNAASSLQQCLMMSKGDILSSLQDKPSDRLFAVFECLGPLVTRGNDDLQGFFWPYGAAETVSKDGEPVLADKSLSTTDVLYSLQTSLTSPKGIFIILSPDQAGVSNIRVIFDERTKTSLRNVSSALKQCIAIGLCWCSQNAVTTSPPRRILCHISRAVLILLWLIDRTDVTLKALTDLLNSSSHRPAKICCTCSPLQQETNSSQMTTTSAAKKGHSLEILPSFRADDGSGNWNASLEPLWDSNADDTSQPDPLESLRNLPLNQSDYYRHGRSNLSYAVEGGYISWTKRLLRLKPQQIHDNDNINRSALSWAIAGRHEETIKLLLESPVIQPDVEDTNYRTPLTWAIQSKFKKGVELLLADQRVDPNRKGRSGRTPLSWAAQRGDPGVVEALLACERTQPHLKDSDDWTPLSWAARLGHESVVRLLLNTNQMDVNHKDLSGRTPLSYAAEKGFLGIAKLLLGRADIEPDKMDNTRTTPLRWALSKGHTEIYNLLLATGKVKSIL